MTTTAIARRIIDADYFRLNKLHPLVRICSDEEYERAAGVLHILSEKAESKALTAGEMEYTETLRVLLEQWDLVRGHLSMDQVVDPIQTLKFLMEQHRMNVAALGKVLGSQPAASMILNGKRELSKTQIKKLATHFHVNAGMFI